MAGDTGERLTSDRVMVLVLVAVFLLVSVGMTLNADGLLRRPVRPFLAERLAPSVAESVADEAQRCLTDQ